MRFIHWRAVRQRKHTPKSYVFPVNMIIKILSSSVFFLHIRLGFVAAIVLYYGTVLIQSYFS